MPWTYIVVDFFCSLQVPLILLFSCLNDSFEVLHHKLLFSFVYTRAVSVWSSHIQLMDVILLPERQFGNSHRVHA